jgi:ABC-type microcin C transport system duplicated ATPase subunit YejF
MLLQVQDLAIEFQSSHKKVQAVDHISFNIQKGEIVMVINTPANLQSVEDDYYLRFESLKKKVLTVTTVAAAQAMTKGIEAFKRDKLKVKALQDYYKS